jgi:enoyl-CoA hydratase/carnithine racemase
VRLGLVYSPYGLRRFVALVGESRTRELFLTAAPVTAERAQLWGLVDRVVSVEDVLPTALALAGAMAENAPLAVAGMRRVLELIAPPIAPEALAEIMGLIDRAWRSEDTAEARAAFLEKRKPQFRGR